MDDAFAGGAATATDDAATTSLRSTASNIVTWPMSGLRRPLRRGLMSWLIVTGALACGAALLNAGIRYWYALGREGILPRARPHAPEAQDAAHRDLLVVTALNITLILAFWFLNRRRSRCTAGWPCRA